VTLLGIDVGTQGSKAGLYSLDGERLGDGYAEHTFDHLRPGWVEMDAAQIFGATLDAIAQAVADAASRGVPASSVQAVALSGILCGPVFVDEAWNPVRPLIPFLDTRCTEQVSWIARECEPLWVQECGNASLDTYMPPAVLRWVRDNEPDVHGRIAKVVSLAPWVAGRLAGIRAADAFTDPSHLSGWIIGWDAAAKDFSDAQLASLGIDRSLAPRVVEPWRVIGGLSKEWAERTGLPVGVPIAAGAGDVMQSNLSAGLTTPGMATDVAGTASILTVGVDRIHPAITEVPGMLYSLATIPGQSLYWGYVKAGGLSLRWFRDELLHRAGDDDVYAEEDRRAAAVAPGSDGVLFMPYLSGGNPDNPDAAGMWLGMTVGTDRKVLWRSMLESIAFEYADFLEVFASNGVPVEEVRAVGGGARSPLWNRIKADATGVPWRVPSRQDGAVLADAALAGLAVGAVPDLASTIGTWVAAGEAAHPDPATVATYAAVRAVRAQVLGGPLRQVFGQIATLRTVGASQEG
jgi:xylulokinase